MQHIERTQNAHYSRAPYTALAGTADTLARWYISKWGSKYRAFNTNTGAHLYAPTLEAMDAKFAALSK